MPEEVRPCSVCRIGFQPADVDVRAHDTLALGQDYDPANSSVTRILRLMQSWTHPGHSTLAYLDALIGVLRGAGFSVVLTAHALSALDAYVYGFAMQERALPFDTQERSAEVVEQILTSRPSEQWPHLVEFSREHVLRPGYDYGREFEWGLDLALDGLERAR